MIMMEEFVISHLAGILYVIDFRRVFADRQKYKKKGIFSWSDSRARKINLRGLSNITQ